MNSSYAYLKERESLVRKQIRANNSMLQSVTENDQAYWLDRRTELEDQIFALDAHHEAMTRAELH